MVKQSTELTDLRQRLPAKYLNPELCSVEETTRRYTGESSSVSTIWVPNYSLNSTLVGATIELERGG